MPTTKGSNVCRKNFEDKNNAEGIEVKQSIEMFGEVKSSNISTPRLGYAPHFAGEGGQSNHPCIHSSIYARFSI